MSKRKYYSYQEQADSSLTDKARQLKVLFALEVVMTVGTAFLITWFTFLFSISLP